MDNILRHIVVAPRDKNLLTRNAVMVIFRDRFAAHRRQIRTRLGLGQVHRPGPFSSDQFFKVLLFELFRGMGLNGLYGSCGQKWAQGKGHVGGIPHFDHCGRNERRQALTVEGRITAKSVPPSGNKTTVRRGKAAGGNDAFSAQRGALLVTRRVASLTSPVAFGGA